MKGCGRFSVLTPWFGMDDLLVVVGVLAFIYRASRRQSRAGPFW